MKSNSNPVFEFEKVRSPIVAERAYQNADKALWETPVFTYIVALIMAAIDMLFLFAVFDYLMLQNELLGYVGAFSFAFLLNIIPTFAAKAVNEHRYNIERNAKQIAILCIFSFAILYIAAILLRFNSLSLFYISEDTKLVNAVSASATETVVQSDGIRKAIITTIGLSIEPLVTSIACFVITLYTDNPLKRKINELHIRRLELKSTKNQLATALEAMWADSDFLLQTDLEQFNAAKEALGATADRLKAEARMMLAEKLKDPTSISALAAKEPADKNIINAQEFKMSSFEAAKKQIS